jgi:AraC-like DNA-binding protein/predicted transcriptional regulator YdeE
MSANFSKIKEAIEYIDTHVDEPIGFEMIAERFHFSPYYFHRVFSTITGKTIAVYIRDRRLQFACVQLSSSDQSILSIGLDCGYNSAQAFTRAFRAVHGLSPSQYRKQGCIPTQTTADELIRQFTNRIKGGIYVKPTIINKEALLIAGVSGDGNRTGDVWSAFEKLSQDKPLKNKLSDNGYEIRLYEGDTCTVYVGLAVSNMDVDGAYTVFQLPAAKYASFDVYVANGYTSENSAMNEWLQTNSEGLSEKLLNGSHYCVEYYDERFSGNSSDSIVEIWIPVEKKN